MRATEAAGLILIAIVLAVLFLLGFAVGRVIACEPEPITPNTPTGIAGCERWGEGIASHYGPGNGVAMNFCTWERRHSSGCGSVTITSLETQISVTAPVVDFCDCYTGTADERIIDLQYGVVDALGLQRSRGLFRVRVEPVSSLGSPAETSAVSHPPAPSPAPLAPLPDTRMSP